MRFRSALCLVALMSTLCCNGDEGIHLDGWEPLSYVDGIPVYTEMTKNEICLTSSVNRVYQERYVIAPASEIDGLFILRAMDDPIPCMDGPHGTACYWSEVNRVFGWGDEGAQGPGGMTYASRYVFVSTVDTHEHFFAFYQMHEDGHAVLNMSHRDKGGKAAWCLWENQMWIEWVEPEVDSSCPNAMGRYGYMCPWS